MKIDREALEQVRKKHGLSLIVLYGSRVTGKTHPASDVDVGVVRKEGEDLRLLELIGDLAAALGTTEVDVADLTHADPLLLYSATRNSRLLAGSVGRLEDLQRLAFHKYSDYLPYLKSEETFVAERIKRYGTD